MNYDKDIDGSAEYKAAYERFDKVSQMFRLAQKKYRALEIGDKAYLAARAVFERATKEFDAAYAKEQSKSTD